MKRSYGKYLISAAIPVIVAVLPSVSFATCTNGVPDGPATWAAGDTVPKSATIGNGTDLGINVAIGGHADIGICDSVGMDGNGGHIGQYTQVDDEIIMINNSWVGHHTRVKSYVTIDGSTLGHDIIIRPGDVSNRTNITGSTIGAYTRIGRRASIDSTTFGQYVLTGADFSVVGSSIGYNATIGDNVTIETGVRVGMEAKIYDGVHIASGVQIGRNARICADVTTPGMVIAAYDKYGCN